MKKQLKALGLILFLHIAVTSTANATIFKCVDKQGDITYIDKPCPVEDEEESLKHMKDPEGSGYLPATQNKSGINTQGRPPGNKPMKQEDSKRPKPLKSSASATKVEESATSDIDGSNNTANANIAAGTEADTTARTSETASEIANTPVSTTEPQQWVDY